MQGSGDVKYHLGTSTDVEIAGHMVHLSLQPNPSHLEAVDPVVVGKVRARQDMAGDTRGRHSVMGILMHGDAAFAGQGLVYETLAMSQLIGYRTGGTVHVVVNNQIGFTTVPAHAYSGLYCTDVAKSIQAPILHVNGDNPEAVVWCAEMAAEFRMTFGCDFVLDIVCYRRHGHNETDEPAFTQPLMYRAIRDRKTTRALYAEQLVAEGVVTADEVKAMWDGFTATLEDAYQAAQGFKPNKADWLEGHWAGLSAPDSAAEWTEGDTAVAPDVLRQVGLALARVPEGFDVNPKIARQLEAKRAMIESGQGIDWATGEALAFGTLLLEGHRVRLSGEDCQRGTFSQRHAVLVDQTNQNEYVPLNNIAPAQAKIEIYNSLLSEAGRAGLRIRLLAGRPALAGAVGGAVRRFRQRRAGDHRPVHRRRRDQVAAHVGPGDAAAARPRGPGAGAFLGAAGALFAALRRAQHDGRQHHHAGQLFPRSAPAAETELPQAAGGDDAEKPAAPQAVRVAAGGVRPGHAVPAPSFAETDAIAPPEQVKRVVLCSGKVYYDLLAQRREQGIDNVALVRLEQLYPFPKVSLPQGAGAVSPAPRWCGARRSRRTWAPGISPTGASRTVLGKLGGAATRPRYIGRRAAASPATGLAKIHAAEQAALVTAALTLELIPWLPTRHDQTGPAAMATEIKVPTLGESVTSATVARWLKKAGEAVAADEPLVELETDKVTVEVNAPAAGTLAEIAADEGAEVGVGALLGVLVDGAAVLTPARPLTPEAGRGRAPGRQPGRRRSTRRPRRPARSPARRRRRPTARRMRRCRPPCG